MLTSAASVAPPDRARVPWVDRLEYAVRSRGAKVVVLALVANTMVAQLLYNSAGQLVLSSGFLLGYLLFSAVCSTVAFALFEVSTIFQLHDLHTLDATIKSEIGADKLIRRGYLVLVVSSLINFLSVLYFLALRLAQHVRQRPPPFRSTICPLRGTGSTTPSMRWPIPWCSSSLASTASGPRSAKEVVLATQRALEQRALELWRLQTEAKIEGMMRRGEPLGAVAAALASHETAERIAVLEAATSGGLTPVQAARLNVRRAGGDVQLLDDLHAHGAGQQRSASP